MRDAARRALISEKERELVSVVVPSYGRDTELHRLVQRILDQNFPAFEVIVVHEGEYPFTSSDARVRVINSRQPIGLPMARNVGIDAASGNYIAFIDDDAYPESLNWLAELVAPFSESRTIGAVGGRIVTRGYPPSHSAGVGEGVGKVVWNSLGMYKFTGNFDLELRTDTDHLQGCNFVVARHALESVRRPYFNPAFAGTSAREETDFFLRIRRNGFRLVHVENGTVIHEFLPFGGVRKPGPKRAFWWGYSEAILFRNAFWDGTHTSTFRFLVQEGLFDWDPYQPAKVVGCIMGLRASECPIKTAKTRRGRIRA